MKSLIIHLVLNYTRKVGKVQSSKPDSGKGRKPTPVSRSLTGLNASKELAAVHSVWEWGWKWWVAGWGEEGQM